MNERFDELESALVDLVPRLDGPAVDRDRLMYLAGQAAASQNVARTNHLRLWQASTAVSAVAALVLATLLVVRGESVPNPPFAQQQQTTESEGSEAPEQLVQVRAPELSDTQDVEQPVEATDVEGRRVVSVPRPVPGEPPLAGAHYLAQRNAALAYGVDVLGSAASADAERSAALPADRSNSSLRVGDSLGLDLESMGDLL